jgi:ATP-dependent RNA helicase DDX23/PRP28
MDRDRERRGDRDHGGGGGRDHSGGGGRDHGGGGRDHGGGGGGRDRGGDRGGAERGGGGGGGSDRGDRAERERRDRERERERSDRERAERERADRGRESAAALVGHKRVREDEEAEAAALRGETKAARETVKKAEPLSLEELIEKKKQLEAEMSKVCMRPQAPTQCPYSPSPPQLPAQPKFLSKEEREAQALQKRQEAADSQRKKLEVSAAHTYTHTHTHTHTHTQEQRQERRQLEIDARKARRETDYSRRDKDGGEDAGEKKDLTEKEAEELAIKGRYFGKEEVKRKIRRMNERKFNFDWDSKEDTSVDYNPIYSDRHEPQFFGRGGFAGVDVVAQKKAAAAFYDPFLEKRRSKAEKEQVCQTCTPTHSRSHSLIHSHSHTRTGASAVAEGG